MNQAPKFKQSQMKRPELVQTSLMFPEQNFILDVKPGSASFDLKEWCKMNADFLRASLLEFGGVTFRGFNLSVQDFKDITSYFSQGDALAYTGGTTPRVHYGDGLYDTTNFDKRCIMVQHHEMSYYRKWPRQIFFYCQTPSTTGGETSIVSTRSFMKTIDPQIVDQYEKHEVKYLRNYAGAMADWKTSFATDNKSEVEKACREIGMQFEWRGESLRTYHVAQGIAKHPETGERIWHNHAHMFTTAIGKTGVMPPLLKVLRPRYTSQAEYEKFLETTAATADVDLVVNCYKGNGQPLDPTMLNEVQDTFESLKVSFKWNSGDLMALDNMLTFHGRNAYEGDQRKIFVMMK